MRKADLDVQARAKVRELRVRRTSGVEVTVSGDAEVLSDTERRNLPHDTEEGETYRDVDVRGTVKARLAAD
jgi:hypothetical protein